jgi:CheY-like chemotaxis protein
MNEKILLNKSLLIVDDEPDLRDIIASELEFLGATVFQAENINAAKEMMKHHRINLIISDIRMPGGTGIDLLNYVKEKNVSEPAVILITGFSDITIEEAFNRGAEALLSKPFLLDDLINSIKRYTSPLLERFQEVLPSDKSVYPFSVIDDVEFGRGGVTLPLEFEKTQFHVGEVIEFDFDYKNKHFSGSGVCRWLGPVIKGSTKSLMGLEFLNLKPKTIENLRNIFENKNIIPYIPYSLNQ